MKRKREIKIYGTYDSAIRQARQYVPMGATNVKIHARCGATVDSWDVEINYENNLPRDSFFSVDRFLQKMKQEKTGR